MATLAEIWTPGSFTKNFSWGSESGLGQLLESIRIGFANRAEDVPRDTFRSRVSDQGRPVYIPINFFLFNKQKDGEDHLIVDELVFQALTGPSGDRFDKLALFAFNLSYAGRFKGARQGQRRPALWAHHYIRDRVALKRGWNTRRVSADDIEAFTVADERYKAEGARKLATNLNHLYRIGRLSEFASDRVERWWVDALFLTMDRLIEDARLDGREIKETRYADALAEAGFHELSGKRSLEKDLATGHLLRLYLECGGRDRFSPESVRERTRVRVSDMQRWISPNDEDPTGAVHPTNPRVLKSIPPTCAMLATYAGFDIVPALELDTFDPGEYVRRRTHEALERLRAAGMEPTMTAEELLRMTRER